MRSALVAVLAAVWLAGCGGAREERTVPSQEQAAGRVAPSDMPEAFLLRFEHAEGTGFSRESWELEVLQMGSDVRVRGGVRTAGSYVPVFRTMSSAEFAEFWQWVRGFPLDGNEVVEDPEAPATGWRKRLKYDAVLGADRRELCDSEWTRRPTGAPWLQVIEDRLHLMVLDAADAEVARARSEASGPVPPQGAARKALDALGDGEITNLPGGSPE